MKKGKSSKINWNVTSAFVLTLISVLAAVASAFFSLQSNRIVEEQNRLIHEAGSPNVLVDYLFSYRDYEDDYKEPCKRPTGIGYWYVEFASGFDISNLGGRTISLNEIRQVNNGKIETFHPLVSATTRFGLFSGEEAFNKWYEVRDAPMSIDTSLQKFEFGGVPMSIGAGETKRILIHGQETVIIDEQLDGQSFQQAMASLGSRWYLPIEFVFADKSIQEIKVPLIRPYFFDPPSLHVDPFVPCQ